MTTDLFALKPGETPCDLLPRLYQMLYSGGAGGSVTETRHKDDWIKFAPPNVGLLRAEIRRLEAICGRNARARRAGPLVNRAAATYYNGHRYGGFYSY